MPILFIIVYYFMVDIWYSICPFVDYRSLSHQVCFNFQHVNEHFSIYNVQFFFLELNKYFTNLLIIKVMSYIMRARHLLSKNMIIICMQI